MNLLDQLIGVTRQGIGLAEAAEGMSKHQLTDLGVLPMDAQKIARVARTYFPVTSAKANAIQAARANGHSIVTLEMIESFVATLNNQRRVWGFRTRACRTVGTHDEVRKACQRLLDDYNGPAAPVPQTRSLQFINSKTKGTGLLFRGPSAEIAALRHAARAAAATAVGEDNVDAKACGDAFADFLAQGAPGSVVHAVVGVSLNEVVRIEDGHGDDIELVASDGSRMTGSEFLERLIRQVTAGQPDSRPAEEPGTEPGAGAAASADMEAEADDEAPELGLFAAEIPTRIPEMVFDDNSMIMLVHPLEGPSNLYRVSRFANGKQRTMLRATFGVCAHPQCNQPAEFCQADHDTAWVRGGMTNINNLTPLCRYHNGANDDDPDGPVRHGRVERDGLDVYRVLPGGRRQRDATPTLARRMMTEHAARRTAQAA
ncbi:HNH endonuclease signature motif containing protein [Corynebacterium frankenforstense]